jgi:hypothetical protein
MEAVTATSLLNAVLENVQSMGHEILVQIIDTLLKELQNVSTPDLSIMLLQGLMTCIWYDSQTTI